VNPPVSEFSSNTPHHTHAQTHACTCKHKHMCTHACTHTHAHTYPLKHAKTHAHAGHLWARRLAHERLAHARPRALLWRDVLPAQGHAPGESTCCCWGGTCTQTHARMHTHTHTHIYFPPKDMLWVGALLLLGWHTHTHTRTHTHAHTHVLPAQGHTLEESTAAAGVVHAHAHAHTHMHTYARAHTHTYAPQGGQMVMPGFTTVLARVADLWERKREDLKAKVGGLLPCARAAAAAAVCVRAHMCVCV